jgi:hypothetical protein
MTASLWVADALRNDDSLTEPRFSRAMIEDVVGADRPRLGRSKYPSGVQHARLSIAEPQPRA